MSKILPTLFLILIAAFVAGVAYLSFIDVPVSQEAVTNTVTLEDFKAKQAP